MYPDEDALTVLRAITDEYAPELLAKRGVQSVGVGYKEVRGEPTGELCVSVAVERKLPASSLGEGDVIPAELSVDDESVPTDVVERPPLRLIADNDAYRPVIGGALYELAGRSVATVCGIAQDATDNRPVFIGCTHCMCVRGNPLQMHQGNVLQPPVGAPGSAIVGRPKRLAPGWQSPKGFVLEADAAIASFSPNLGSHALPGWVAEMGPGPIAGRVRGPVLSERVRTRGAATGHVVFAQVKRIGLTWRVQWPGPGSALGPWVSVRNSFELECAVGQTVGIPGDSGAPVYAAEEQDALGVWYATSSEAPTAEDRKWGHANNLDTVFEMLTLRTYSWDTLPSFLHKFKAGDLPTKTDVPAAHVAPGDSGQGSHK